MLMTLERSHEKQEVSSMQSQELDSVLEAAIVSSWPELVPDDGAGQIHIEYELGAAAKITFLRVWFSKRRGIWHLICTWSVGPSGPRNRKIQFEAGYVSEELNGSLNSILQHQDAFVLPASLDREGLVQIGTPSQKERAAAVSLIRQALDQIRSGELAAA